MKKRFSEEQIVRMLRQAEAADQTVAEVCKQHGGEGHAGQEPAGL